jgi:hypothetical protein
MESSNLNLDFPPNLEVAIRTLTFGGYLLEGANRKPGYALIYMDRYDEFGARQKYCFTLFENDPGEGEVQAAEIAAKYKKATLVVISPSIYPNLPSIEWERFINLFGGPVFSLSPLESEFADHLSQLGHNHLPTGVDGKADDLFEKYIRNALEFIFGCKVIPYGQERRFEPRPDGIIWQREKFTALYDAKAYSSGYAVTANTIRQFSSYVSDFRKRYNQFFTLNAFIVISADFPHRKSTLESRSREFQADAGVPLIFLKSDMVIEMIKLLAKSPSLRRSISWRKVFTNPVIELSQVKDEIRLIQKDQIIPKIGV